MGQFRKAWCLGETRNLIDWAEGKQILHPSPIHWDWHRGFEQLKGQVGVDTPFIITQEY
jgi:hypothetical protein|tara:strand:+ start:3280 stop:3456 length:177 start_codon:yes stop_codon:yes gene_type:complete